MRSDKVALARGAIYGNLIGLFRALRLFLDLARELRAHVRMRERQHRFAQDRRLDLDLWLERRYHLAAAGQMHVGKLGNDFGGGARW